MSHWKNKLEIGDLHNSFRYEKITPQELADGVIKRMKALRPNLSLGRFPSQYLDLFHEFDAVIEELEVVGDDIEQYDHALEMLYDLGDTQLNESWPPDKFLWIETINSSSESPQSP